MEFVSHKRHAHFYSILFFIGNIELVGTLEHTGSQLEVYLKVKPDTDKISLNKELLQSQYYRVKTSSLKHLWRGIQSERRCLSKVAHYFFYNWCFLNKQKLRHWLKTRASSVKSLWTEQKVCFRIQHRMVSEISKRR